MSTFVEQGRALIHADDVRISEHGDDELAEDGLSAREVLAGIPEAILVEEYPDVPKGPCAVFFAERPNGSAGPCCMGHHERS